MLETPTEFLLHLGPLSLTARGVVSFILAVPVGLLLIALSLRLLRR